MNAIIIVLAMFVGFCGGLLFYAKLIDQPDETTENTINIKKIKRSDLRNVKAFDADRMQFIEPATPAPPQPKKRVFRRKLKPIKKEE
jgi:hypothetical protein